MINEQFSLLQLMIAVVSSGVLSSFVTVFSSRKQNLATVDETVRNTLSEVISDLQMQIKFLQEQIVSALAREKEYLSLLASSSNQNQSLQAELAASQLFVKNLEAQKSRYEQKLSKYEDFQHRTEINTGA